MLNRLALDPHGDKDAGGGKADGIVEQIAERLGEIGRVHGNGGHPPPRRAGSTGCVPTGPGEDLDQLAGQRPDIGGCHLLDAEPGGLQLPVRALADEIDLLQRHVAVLAGSFSARLDSTVNGVFSPWARSLARARARSSAVLALLDQHVDFLDQRADLARPVIAEIAAGPRADAGNLLLDAAERGKPDRGLQEGGSQQQKRGRPQHAGNSPWKEDKASASSCSSKAAWMVTGSTLAPSSRLVSSE